MIEHLVHKFKKNEENNKILVDYFNEFMPKGEKPPGLDIDYENFTKKQISDIKE
jgi:hypothetical protein